MLKISFDYLVNSGTFNAGSISTESDVIAYLYDVTNGVLIEPSNIKMFSNSADVSDKFEASFQSSFNGESYRLILHIQSVSASAFELKIDNVSVSPESFSHGAVITERKAYTPIFTGFGTVSGVDVKSWREGAHLCIEGRFNSGTPTPVEARISLGFSGFEGGVVTPATLPSTQIVGYGVRSVSTSDQHTLLAEPSVGYLTFGIQNGSFAGLNKQPATSIIGAGQAFSFFAKVPVQGWQTSAKMSSEGGTRVVTLMARLNAFTHTSSGSEQTLSNWSDPETDRLGGFNKATGVYTVKEPGYYEIDVMAGFGINGTGWRYLAAFKNSTKIAYSPNVAGSASFNVATDLHRGVECVAGDTLSVKAWQNSGGSLAFDNDLSTQLSIVKVQGPSALAQDERVKVKYTNSSGQVISSGSGVRIDYSNKVEDSHGAVTTGALWSFKAPRADTYLVSAQITWPPNTTGYRSFDMRSIALGSTIQYAESGPAPATVQLTQWVHTLVPLKAGEDLYFMANHNAGVGLALPASPIYNSVSISSVG
jgi:hypothetical protein